MRQVRFVDPHFPTGPSFPSVYSVPLDPSRRWVRGWWWSGTGLRTRLVPTHGHPSLPIREFPFPVGQDVRITPECRRVGGGWYEVGDKRFKLSFGHQRSFSVLLRRGKSPTESCKSGGSKTERWSPYTLQEFSTVSPRLGSRSPSVGKGSGVVLGRTTTSRGLNWGLRPGESCVRW